MATYRVTYSDGDTLDVSTGGGEAAAKQHAEALEGERVGRALRAGINLAPRGLRPDIEVLKADKADPPPPRAKSKA